AGGASEPRTRVVILSTSTEKAHGKAAAKNIKIDADLPVAAAVSVDATNAEVSDLANDPDVVVVPDVSVELTDTVTSTTRPPAAVFPATTGSSALVAKGYTGKGQTVAVLDTGIAPLPDFAGRLVGGVDLSGEGNAFLDSYGHGTF